MKRAIRFGLACMFGQAASGAALAAWSSGGGELIKDAENPLQLIGDVNGTVVDAQIWDEKSLQEGDAQ